MNYYLRYSFLFRFILPLILVLSAHKAACGATGYADSAVFPLDARDTIASVAVDSNVFSLEARNRGNSDSSATGSFALNTMVGVSTDLVIIGPSEVLAGSKTPYQVKWRVGNSENDVTAEARWRFAGGAPGNTGMVPPDFYAGETPVAATTSIIASYAGPNGVSFETPPFLISIKPRLAGTLGVVQVSPTSGVVNFSASVQGAVGATVVRWDLDGDKEFDDAVGESVTRDYSTWTGTTNVTVEITDSLGNRRIETRSIVLNKPAVSNQPRKPVYDPGGFSMYLPDYSSSPFVFNAGGVSRRQSGLVVLIHGLYSSGGSDWLSEMGVAIKNRCIDLEMTAPDIAIMDWSNLAGDPSELPETERDRLTRLINSGEPISWLTGQAGFKINTFFDIWHVRPFGITAGQYLANWVYLNGRLGTSPQIDVTRPIHLIGHSAGGFVAGEAARLLKIAAGGTSPIFVDRVTMLDTPFPFEDHLTEGSAGYPNPGFVDRYISSFYGAHNMPDALFTYNHSWLRTKFVYKSVLPWDRYSIGDNGHGYAHVWYTKETIWNWNQWVANDGFTLSPIINPSTRIAKPSASPIPALSHVLMGIEPQQGALPDLVPENWQTFGNSSVSTGTWTVVEAADTGIWADVDLPVTASAIHFEFRFLAPGDGDFLAVHFGDMPVLYQGLDLALTRDTWIPVEIPIGDIPVSNDKLIFTLVSRGATNAVLGLRNIRLSQSDDPDNDGLPNAQEALAGTNPRMADTDGDGIADGEEALNLSSSPLLTDSDGDGVGDQEELRAGTSPIQAASVLRVSAYALNPQASRLEVRWPSVAGKSYTVFRSQEVGTGNFHLLTTGVAGTGAQVSFVDEQPPTGPVYYWVSAE